MIHITSCTAHSDTPSVRSAQDACILSRHGLRALLPAVEKPPSTLPEAIALWGNGAEVLIWAAWRDGVRLERAVAAGEAVPERGHASDRPSA